VPRSTSRTTLDTPWPAMRASSPAGCGRAAGGGWGRAGG
jgi:hypothetical protein